jgi:ribosomal-protein-alanine N-acetyltransferase
MQTFEQPTLETGRLVLEPVVEAHAEELCELFRDPDLHRYVPYEEMKLDQHRARCRVWATRTSPDGSELWLNWAGRERESRTVIAHFQASVTSEEASVAYLVVAAFQRRGFAREGLRAVFDYLRDVLAVPEIKAWIDTRNEPSQRLAKSLGMVQVDFVKDADFFKGETSDEYVFGVRWE